MMILMLGSISGMAGHDLMVHLAIHHQGPFGEENVQLALGFLCLGRRIPFL